MSVRQNKPTAAAIIVTGVVSGLGLMLARGSFADHSFMETTSAIGIALVVAFLFFGSIHLLLKRWDRWRGR